MGKLELYVRNLRGQPISGGVKMGFCGADAWANILSHGRLYYKHELPINSRSYEKRGSFRSIFLI